MTNLNEIIVKMENKINKQLEKIKNDFNNTNRYNELLNAELDGMIDMLSMVTGKEYIVTSDCKLKTVEMENE